jgi:Zn-finger nucleic acid-binding protein
MITMFCPVCKTADLVMSDRQGIEIDYCPMCRGVWLDRGELDKLIERSVRPAAAAPAVPAYAQDQSRGHPDRPGFKDSDFGHKNYGHAQPGPHGQRRSFWRELFD